jgi:hypothetical protein
MFNSQKYSPGSDGPTVADPGLKNPNTDIVYEGRGIAPARTSSTSEMCQIISGNSFCLAGRHLFSFPFRSIVDSLLSPGLRDLIFIVGSRNHERHELARYYV